MLLLTLEFCPILHVQTGDTIIDALGLRSLFSSVFDSLAGCCKTRCATRLLHLRFSACCFMFAAPYCTSGTRAVCCSPWTTAATDLCTPSGTCACSAARAERHRPAQQIHLFSCTKVLCEATVQSSPVPLLTNFVGCMLGNTTHQMRACQLNCHEPGSR